MMRKKKGNSTNYKLPDTVQRSSKVQDCHCVIASITMPSAFWHPNAFRDCLQTGGAKVESSHSPHWVKLAQELKITDMRVGDSVGGPSANVGDSDGEPMVLSEGLWSTDGGDEFHQDKAKTRKTTIRLM
jgi:hypothetical protein